MKYAMMKSTIAVLIILVSPMLLFGRAFLNGKLTDVKTNAPLVGAYVVLENSNQTALSDDEGKYSFVIPGVIRGDTIHLEISHPGYRTFSTSIVLTEVETTFDWAMRIDDTQLNIPAVTASKLSQSAQQVPISLSSLSSDQVGYSGVRQFRDYASGITNLSFGTQGAGLHGRYDNDIVIRGIAGNNTAAMYLDESLLVENIDPRLFDIAQIEILKGPQGTLYGSRNMGGAVKVITNQPQLGQLGGSAGITMAKVNEGDMDFGLEGVLNIPISKKIAFRTIGFFDFESGVFDRSIYRKSNVLNQIPEVQAEYPNGTHFPIKTDFCQGCDFSNRENIDDEKNYGVHASLKYVPHRNISVVLKMIAQRQAGDNQDFAEGYAGNFEQERIAGMPETFEDSWRHYNVTVGFRLRKGKLISATSFLNRTFAESDDFGEYFNREFGYFDGIESLDYFASTIEKRTEALQFNQEFRFHSDLNGRFNFTFGGYYRENRENETWFSGNTGAASYIAMYVYQNSQLARNLEEAQLPFFEAGGKNVNKEAAVFGEAYFDITRKIKATVGVRYFMSFLNIDEQYSGFNVDQEFFETNGDSDESGISPKLSLSYQLNKEKMVFASVSHGYRLGGLNGLVPETVCREELAELPGGTYPLSYESDYVWGYELGFKGVWANGKVMSNASIFYNDWKNMQQNHWLGCGFSYVSNAGAAHTSGLEINVRAKPYWNLEIGGGLGLLDAVIDESDDNVGAESGDRILFTPRMTANAHFRYTRPLTDQHDFFLQANIQHVGDRLNTYTPEDPTQLHLIFDAYSIVNARVGIQLPEYELSVFVNNLTNTAANYGDIRPVVNDLTGRNRYATNRPFTFGVQARMNF